MFEERRLRKVSTKLKKLRADLALADEQLLLMADDADDARIRSIVADNRLAAHEAGEDARHVDAMRRHRDDLRASIARLEAEQDELLDRM